MHRSGAVFVKGGSQYLGIGPAHLSSAGRPTAFKPPVKLGATSGAAPPAARILKPLHDPLAPGALLLNAGLWSSGGGREGKVMPVVVDPYLARSLRPHQEEGIRFMYRWGEEGAE